MTIYSQKELLKFKRRFILNLQSISWGVWAFLMINIFFPVIFLFGYREYNQDKLIAAIFVGVVVLIIVLISSFRNAIYYVLDINIEEKIKIVMHKYNERIVYECDKRNLTYITRQKGRWTPAFLLIMEKNKPVLKVYETPKHWEWEEIKNIDVHFKKNGVLKPFGENL